MKEEVKDKWVKALRSGEYKQGKNRLEDKQGNYCCLGVLCVLAQKEGVKIDLLSNPEQIIGVNIGDQPEVRRWASIKQMSGSYGPSSLVRDNDSGATFPEIADIIEENWKTL